MSKLVLVILFVMVVLVGAMGLKKAVTSNGNGAVVMANGGMPVPPGPYK
jgi:hypothetical protein